MKRLADYLLPFVSLAAGLACFCARLALERFHLAGTGMALVYRDLLEQSLALAGVTLLGASVIMAAGIRWGWWSRLSARYMALPQNRKNLLVLGLSFVCIFALFGRNILGGFFNFDDFLLFTAQHDATSFMGLLLTPHGSHPLPLFRVEIAALRYVFGLNALAFNLFVYALLALIPYFTYRLMNRLGFSEKSYFIFFILFACSTIWGDVLTGYHILSVYIQSSLACILALLAYIRWRETSRRRFLALFSLSIFWGSLIDIAGVWIIPAALIFIVAYSLSKDETTRMILSRNGRAFIALGVPTLLFAVYLIGAQSTVHDGTIVQAHYDVLKIIENIYLFLSSGLFSLIFTPRASTFLLQPDLYRVLGTAWKTYLAVAFILQAGMAAFVFRRSGNDILLWLVSTSAILFMPLMLVVLARQTTSMTYDFPPAHTVMPYFWYCFILALFAEAAAHRSERSFWIRKGVYAFLIVFVTIQLASSFFNDETLAEARTNAAALHALQHDLAPVLARMKDDPAPIPELRGIYIDPLLADYDLYQYRDFLSLPANIVILKGNQNLRERTGREFLSDLASNAVLRSYYLKSVDIHSDNTLRPTTSPAYAAPRQVSAGVYEIRVPRGIEETPLLGLKISTTEARFALDLYGENDFAATTSLAHILVDQFTEHTNENGILTYTIYVDLRGIYALSLSRSIDSVRVRFDTTDAHTLEATTY